MSLKKLGIALGAVLAIGALLASSAFASPVTNKAQWVNSAGETISGNSVTCANSGAGNLQLGFTFLGSPGLIEAEQVSSIGALITNTEVEGVHMATASGKLKFTGLTVVKPEGCTVEPIETVALTANLKMDSENSSKAYVEFKPASGTKFVTMKVRGCAFEGNYGINGVLYGEAASTTGSVAETHALRFNETTTLLSSLSLGAEPAAFLGEVSNTIAGISWGAKEQ